jgi:hypothetical protein
MTYKTIPWPSVPGVGPAYSADDWKQMHRTFGGPHSPHANSGVIWTTGFPLRVLASDPASMIVKVQPGSAFVDGLWVNSDAEVSLNLDAADPTYKRIDLVVLRSDATGKTATVAVKTGTPGPVASPPALDQTDPYYEIPLAQIEVGAGVSSVNDGKILDARRFHNAAADYQVIPAKTLGTINRGEAVYWRPAEYPSGANGVNALVVSKNPYDPTYIAPLAGVVLETAVNDWTLVLMRGLYQMRVAASEIINTLDLVASNGGTEVFPAGRGTNAAPVLGTALSWQHTPPGYVWVYVDPASFHGIPRIARSIGLLGGNVTTTAVNWVDLSAFSALTVRARFAWLELILIGSVSNGGAGNNTFITFSVDGVDIDEPVWVGTNSANYRTPVHARHLLYLGTQPQPNKAFTIKPRWKVSAGTSTFYNTSGQMQGQFIVREAPYVEPVP